MISGSCCPRRPSPDSASISRLPTKPSRMQCPQVVTALFCVCIVTPDTLDQWLDPLLLDREGRLHFIELSVLNTQTFFSLVPKQYSVTTGGPVSSGSSVKVMEGSPGK